MGAGLYDSGTWLKDLDEVIEELPEIQELAGTNVLVTGCTGLICSALIDILIRWNKTGNSKIGICAAGRNKKKVEERFAPYINENWFTFVYFDAVSTKNSITHPCDYIIHGASNASPDKIIKEPVETMLGNFTGTRYLLDYAVKNKTERFLYVSSSEVYGRKEHDHPSKTDEYGWIDLLNPRSAYSIGKCAAETLCASYAAEYGVDYVVIRPGHIYGPTATLTDNRVASAWAYAAARGENIVMKSDGLQIRSYCYCLDNAAAILKVLLRGESLHAYNVSNPESIINIRTMAEILAKSAQVELRTELPTETEKKGFNPMSNSSLDSEDLIKLGWRGLFDAERGLSHTIEILREMIDQ